MTCHALLYMAADRRYMKNYVDLSYDDIRLKQFYHGEEIETDSKIKGFLR